MPEYISNADLPHDLLADMAQDAESVTLPVGDRLQRLSYLAEELRLAQIKIYEADRDLARAEVHERQLREIDIPELMKECGMKDFRLSNGVKVSVGDDIRCSISEERKAAAFSWLREHQLGGIIKSGLEIPIEKLDELQQEALDKTKRYLIQCGFNPSVVESVHWQTLKATLKEEREKGNPVPDEIFALFPFQTTKLEFPAGVERPKKPRAKK